MTRLNRFRTNHIIWNTENQHINSKLGVSTSDELGRILTVELNNYKASDLEGLSLRLYWKGVNEGFNDFDLVDDIFKIYLPSSLGLEPGKVKAWLHLSEPGSFDLTSKPFNIEVFKGIDTDSIEASDDFSALKIILDKFDSGEMKGEKGDPGEPGPVGPAPKWVALTQEEYNALDEIDPNKVYLIVEPEITWHILTEEDFDNGTYIGNYELVEFPDNVDELGRISSSSDGSNEWGNVKAIKYSGPMSFSGLLAFTEFTEIDLSEFKPHISNDDYLEGLFSDVKAPKLDLSHWDTTNVGGLERVFTRIDTDELNLSNWFIPSYVMDMNLADARIKDLYLNNITYEEVEHVTKLLSNLLDPSGFTTGKELDNLTIYVDNQELADAINNINEEYSPAVVGGK